jgi:hypothetical protein
MDLLFAAETPWAWDAEHNYRKLAGENPQILQATRRIKMVLHPETGLLTTGTASILSSVNGAEKRSSMITSSLPEVSDAEERVSAITSSLPGDRRGRTRWAFDPRYTSFLWDEDEHIEHVEDVQAENEVTQPTQVQCKCPLAAGFQTGL